MNNCRTPQAVAKSRDEEVDSSVFLTMLNMTVQKHKCQIEDIDFDSFTVHITGPTDEAQYECAVEVSMLFDKYLV